MNASLNVSFPKEFDTSLIIALQAETSLETDQKIRLYLKETNLLSIFTHWVVDNGAWGKKHLVLIDELMMLSLSQKIIKTITFIEKLVTNLWNTPQTEGKLVSCFRLFKYIETELPDIKHVKSTLETFSDFEKNSFVSLKNRVGKNVLHISANRGDPELFLLFLDLVPDILRKAHLCVEDMSRKNVLHYALHDNAQASIIEHIVKSYPKSERRLAVQSALMKHGFSNFTDFDREPILKALLYSVPQKERMLLLKRRDLQGHTLMESAIRSLAHYRDLLFMFSVSVPKHFLSSIKIILEALSKTDQDDAVRSTDHKGRNLLHLVLSYAHKEVLETVINAAIDPAGLIDAADKDGKCSLHYAALSINIVAMRVFIQIIKPEALESHLNQTDFDQRTVLYYAALKGNIAFNQLLVEALPESAQQTFTLLAEVIINEYPQESKRTLKCVRKITPPHQIPHLLPVFKVVEERDTIFLLGRSLDFLKEKGELLIRFGQNIDPHYNITQFTIEEHIEDGFSYRLALHELFPKFLTDSYGTYSSCEGNCHGAALFAAGIAEEITALEEPYCHKGLLDKTQIIALSKLSPGDLVYLKEGPKGTLYEGKEGAHSFVYLSDDMCLSMNGGGRKLKLHATFDVLKYYGFPMNALKSSALKKHIVILRKLKI